MVVHEEMTIEEKANLRLAELEALDENRLVAKQNMELYCLGYLIHLTNECELCSFQKGDLVLEFYVHMIIGKKKERWSPIVKATYH